MYDLWCADKRDEEKRSKYFMLGALGARIIPFAIETTGGWGREFAAFFKEWVTSIRQEAREDGEGEWSATHRMQEWQQRIAVTMYASLAQRVARVFVPRVGGGAGG